MCSEKNQCGLNQILAKRYTIYKIDRLDLLKVLGFIENNFSM